jgi:tetratricopeptide (TPR) repeat protein
MRLIQFLPPAALVFALASSITPVQAESVTVTFQSEHREKLDAGFDALWAGQYSKAEKIFARVITDFEEKHSGQRIYRCADGMDDTLQVAILAAADAGTGPISVLGPEWCEALFGMGYVLIDLKRSDEAGKYLARAVEMAPTKAHYINEYAEWYKSRREWQRSHDLFAQAWDKVSHDKAGPNRTVAARALRGMGFNKIELGDLDEAKRLFNQSLEFELENAMAKSELEYIARLEATRADQK